MTATDGNLARRLDPLDVRVRLVVAGDGTETRRASVHCPTQQRDTTLEECMQCDRCAGLFFDAARRRSRVLCGWTPHQGLSVSSLPPHWHAPDEASATTPVSAVMCREVVCVRSEMPVDTLTALLLDRSIGGVPVVDDRGRPIGVVSKTDVTRSSHEPGDTRATERAEAENAWEYDAPMSPALQAQQANARIVADIMTPMTFALEESASVAQAAALMAYEGVHRLPVVSTAREVVGVISTLDILRWIGQRNGYLVPEEPRLHGG